MEKYWFTSDWHLDHMNIVSFAHRPFKNAFTMNERIIANFNRLVNPEDKVYFLGDFCFSRDPSTVRQYLNQVNGEWTFIMGNHDYSHGLKQTFKQYGVVYDLKNIQCYGQQIVLCHYPMVSHSSSHYNTWQLYGHHHGWEPDKVQGKKMNVGVDLHGFRPVSFEEVGQYMRKREDNWDLKEDDRNKIGNGR